MTFRATDHYRFLQLVSGVWCGMLVSTIYLFPIFTHPMKEKFHFSQDNIDSISTFSFCTALLCGFPAGVIFDRFGPRTVIAIATLMLFIGSVLLSLIFSEHIKATPATVAVSASIAYSSAGWFDTGTMTTLLFTFPLNRGEIIVMQKAMAGLGASCYAIFYACFFSENYSGFLNFIAGTSIVFGGICWAMAVMPSYYQKHHVSEHAERNAAELRNNLQSLTRSLSDLDGSIVAPHPTAVRLGADGRPVGVAADDDLADSLVSSGAPPPRDPVGTVNADTEPLSPEETVRLQEERLDEAFYLNIPANKVRLRIGLIMFGVVILFVTIAGVTIAYQQLSHESSEVLGVFCGLLVSAFLLMALLPNEVTEPKETRRRIQKYAGQMDEFADADGTTVEDPAALGSPARRDRSSSPSNLRNDTSQISMATAKSYGSANSKASSTLSGDERREQQNRLAAPDAQSGRPRSPGASSSSSRLSRTSSAGDMAEEEREEEAKRRRRRRSRHRRYRKYLRVQLQSTLAHHRWRPLETTFWQSLRGLDVWLLWFFALAVWGAGSTVITNLTQIYRAVNEGDFDQRFNSMLVVVSGTGSALGRVCVGLFDMLFARLSSRGGSLHSITRLLPICTLWTALTLPSLLIDSVSFLPVAVGLVSFGYGMSWGLVPLTARLVWRRDMGKHYDFTWTAGVVALLSFNYGMFGHLYKHEGKEEAAQMVLPSSSPAPPPPAILSSWLLDSNHTNAPSSLPPANALPLTCIGVDCYQTTILTLAGVNVLATLAALVFHLRWMRRHKDIAKLSLPEREQLLPPS